MYKYGLAGSLSQGDMLNGQTSTFGDYGKKLTVDAYTQDTPELSKVLGNTGTDGSFLSGLGSWLDNNSSTVNAGFGAAQLGLGLAGFLENQKTAGLQRDILKQQIGSNKTEIANRNKFLSGMSNLKSVAG